VRLLSDSIFLNFVSQCHLRICVINIKEPPSQMSLPLVTFDIFSLVADISLQDNRHPDAIIYHKSGTVSYIYDRPFLRSFLNWCKKHFTIGVLQPRGSITDHVFQGYVEYMSPASLKVPLDVYNPKNYDTQLSENGCIRLWLQKFIDSKMESLEDFAREFPYVQPKPYKQGEYNPPTSAHYGQVSVPRSIEMPEFVGRDGFHLKRITQLSQCEYLWFDTTRSVVEIWGREHKIPKAQRMLERRIKSFMDNNGVGNKPHKSTEFDVPEGVSVFESNVPTKKIKYSITGPEALCMQFYTGCLLTRYPTNPYFTKIEKKEQLPSGAIRITVTRADSCD
jgi:hypothetical protein